MASSFIHFRSTEALEQLLDAEVEALRRKGVHRRLANRSAVARSILTMYLSTRLQAPLRHEKGGAELDGETARASLTRAAAREIIEAVGDAAPTALQRALTDALEKMPERLESILAEAAG